MVLDKNTLTADELFTSFHWQTAEGASGRAINETTIIAARPILPSKRDLIMADRLRHCVECPECCTRYLIGFSPYRNGSYLLSFVTDSSEEYKLLCSCRRPPVCSRWNWSEMKTYAVSNGAYARGYGQPDEIWLWKDHADGDMGLLNASTLGEMRKRTDKSG